MKLNLITNAIGRYVKNEHMACRDGNWWNYYSLLVYYHVDFESYQKFLFL